MGRMDIRSGKGTKALRTINKYDHSKTASNSDQDQ